MTFGKHRLFERISPKKSWEGSIGGAIIACLSAYIISLFFKELTTIQWLILAPIVIFSATYGDLAESLFKRSINIKDSGDILPGHGGILDRFDSVFLSAPIIFVYLQLINL
jgi:phosphatidate cytidylyltransferase